MSVADIFGQQKSLKWHMGVPYTVADSPAFYVNEWDSTDLLSVSIVPYSRIAECSVVDMFGDAYLNYTTMVKGVYADQSETKIEKAIDVAYKEYLRKMESTYCKLDRKLPVIGMKVGHTSASSEVFRITIVPVIPWDGLTTMWNVSQLDLVKLFYGSMAYQVSKRGTIYYSRFSEEGIKFRPTHTHIVDKPVKHILDACRSVVADFIKDPRSVLIVDPPIEGRKDLNLGALAFRRLTGDGYNSESTHPLFEEWRELMSHGCIFVIHATDGIVSDVMTWK